jgi:hypothetical protein
MTAAMRMSTMRMDIVTMDSLMTRP